MIKNKWHGTSFPACPVHFKQLNETDYNYHSLLEKVLKEGIWKENRTGTRTLSIFGPQICFENVGERFPLLTTKKLSLKSIIEELLWFLSGSTNKKDLQNKGVTIWDEWNAPNPKFDGDMGPIYGHQWVNWQYYEENNGELIKKSINQLQNIIDTLKTNPDDRRMIVSAWHVDEIKNMALPPCHWSYQFYSVLYPNEEKRTLHIKMNIRSWDFFLGGPFNIASYALLLMMMAQEVNMKPGDLYISAGDVHIYENHLEYVYKQLERDSKSNEPIMVLNKDKNFWNFQYSDFELKGYDAHTNFKNVPIAV
jgi:thymidylate synthase